MSNETTKLWPNRFREAIGFSAARWISRIMFSMAAIYSLALTVVGMVAFDNGYRPEAHSAFLFYRYLQTMLVCPLFLISLIPRRWTTVPLWFICLSISSLPYLIRNPLMKTRLGYFSRPFGSAAVEEIALIMVLPVVVQLAAWLRPSRDEVAAHRIALESTPVRSEDV